MRLASRACVISVEPLFVGPENDRRDLGDRLVELRSFKSSAMTGLAPTIYAKVRISAPDASL